MYATYFLYSILLTLLTPTVLSNPLAPRDPFIPVRSCGTSNPGDGLRAAHDWLRTAEREVQSGARSANLTGIIGKRQIIPANQVIVVDTWFHIVSTAAHQNLVTDTMIRNQVCPPNSLPPFLPPSSPLFLSSTRASPSLPTSY